MDVLEMKELIRDAVGDVDLRAGEIPSIDLYVDQITSLTSDKLKSGSPRFQDRVLTKTMINNYSKDGLISPIKGKKYSKEQIMQMLLVYSMKNTLSIGEIKRVLQNVYQLPECNGEMLEQVWSKFLGVKVLERDRASEMLVAFLEQTGLDPADDADFLTLILGLSAMSDYAKNAVQALLEARYPDLNAEREREEQEKKEEVRRQKEEKKEEKKAAKSKKDESAKEEQA